MKKIHSFFIKIIAAVCNFFGIGLITGCDGVVLFSGAPAMYGSPPLVSGYVTGDIDGDGKLEPVKGIKITSTTDASVEEFTSENGSYSFRPLRNEKYIITFEDVDGEDNGSFNTVQKEVQPIFYDNGWGGQVEVNVELEKK
jgi:hypothetical protein